MKNLLSQSENRCSMMEKRTKVNAKRIKCFFRLFSSWQSCSCLYCRARAVKIKGYRTKRVSLMLREDLLEGYIEQRGYYHLRYEKYINTYFSSAFDSYRFQIKNMEKYQTLQQIGRGSFGVVHKVKRISDGELFVWKEINFQKMSCREKQQLVTEVNLLKGLDHPNIVRYEDRIVDKKTAKVFIIMEYCSGGDLGQYLKQCKKTLRPIPEEIIWKIAYQLLLALDYCHSRGTDQKGRGGKVLHRDIKPANIFINNSSHIKLGDFGLSREMGEHSEFAKTNVGTPYYMSPEQVRDEKYNQKSDIWSAGCLIYELAALRRPFEASNHLALSKKIGQGKYERIPYRYSENLYEVIKKMLVVDLQRRYSAKDLLQHPIFRMRTKENVLKDKIGALKERELKLREKEREIQYLKNNIISMRGSFEKSQEELQLPLTRKKSSRESEKTRYADKQNRNNQNLQMS